ncbi:BTRF1 [macacine gammaherpesvirus 10]|uniref:BTRF1 n=1 Tax=macacine gammaherpesvirus 10 TaxID=2560569 RepID=A0A0S0BW22_9GAMA|nr:BTRF1 [macacine gammaherpesvirus 10]ALF03267.1 BTRF1 [macacine gammaherpesvirus 10]
MLKCKQPGARFVHGAVHLPSGQIVFHTIHSPTLASALGLSGENVPIPALFRASGLNVRESLPMTNIRAPIISLARLILAPNPYILEGQLTVGMTQDNGIPVLFSQPIIEVKSGPESHIKAPSQLVIAEDSCLDQIAPFSASEHPAFSMVESVKRVRVDEGANTRRTIRELLEIPVTVLSSLNLSPTKSILKKPPEPQPEPQTSFDPAPYARIFYDIGRQVPKLGNAPACQVSNVLIANRSHNSLKLVPNTNLLPLQHLFLKHVVLKSLNLENIVEDFEAIFTSQKDTVSEAETGAFVKLVETAKTTIENIVFCLNSICSTSSLPDVVPDVNNPNISLALEKYFLMFPPTGTIMRNVRFATPIVQLLCQGAELGTMAQFLGKYIKIKKETGMYTLVKLYYLLRI